MAFRGSLPKCIEQLGYFYRTFPKATHAIIFNEKGSYYTALQESEIQAFMATSGAEANRVVFLGTLSELRSLQATPQIILL